MIIKTYSILFETKEKETINNSVVFNCTKELEKDFHEIYGVSIIALAEKLHHIKYKHFQNYLVFI